MAGGEELGSFSRRTNRDRDGIIRKNVSMCVNGRGACLGVLLCESAVSFGGEGWMVVL